MRSKRLFVWAVVVCLFGQVFAGAQDGGAGGSLAAGSSRQEGDMKSPLREGAVPRLIRFSGILQNLTGKPIAGPVDVTFSLYSDEAGGAPLWFETQTVQADSFGHYTVLLGAMTPAGVPMELFTEGQAHWLDVMVQGLPEQSRVLLVSVPYAMKAGDAETLGGKPASQYQLAPQSDASSRGTDKNGTTTTRSGKQPTKKTESPITQAFTQNYIPVFSDNLGNLTNSIMVQSGTKIGINTNAPAFNLDLNGAVFAVGTKTPLAGAGGTMRFRDDTATVRWLFGIPGVSGSTDFFIYNYSNGHQPLYIQGGAASNSLYLAGSGNVGVGTSSPAAKLAVAGDIFLAGSLNTGLRIQANATSPNITGGYSGNTVTPGVVGATISGGGLSSGLNLVFDDYGTVAGGNQNSAGNNSGTTSDAPNATVGGGYINVASGSYATVPGGAGNTAAGDYSFAAGHGALADHFGSFVWRDGEAGSIVHTSANDQFLIRAIGGVGIIQSSPSGPMPAQFTVSTNGGYSFPQADLNQQNSGDFARFRLSTTGTTNIWDIAGYNGAGSRTLSFWAGSSAGGGNNIMSLIPDDATNLLTMSNGARLTAGGAWTNSSDRNVKTDFAAVDGREILRRLGEIPVQEWRYKAEPHTVHHIGPMAQDFREAFGLGDDDKHIATVDADGVALAAIQALYRLSQEKDDRIGALTREVDELRARLAKIENAAASNK